MMRRTYTSVMVFFPSRNYEPGIPQTGRTGQRSLPQDGEEIGFRAVKPATGGLGIASGSPNGWPFRVRWFYCSPFALPLPFPTAFVSGGWDQPVEWNPVVGEPHYPYPPPMTSALTPPSAIGFTHCGSPEEFLHGVDHWCLTTRDIYGVSECCARNLGLGLSGATVVPATGGFGLTGSTLPTTSMGLVSWSLDVGNMGLTKSTILSGVGAIGLTSVMPTIATGELSFGSPMSADSAGRSIGFGGFAASAGAINLSAVLPASFLWGWCITPIAQNGIGFNRPVALSASGKIGMVAEIPPACEIGFGSVQVSPNSIGCEPFDIAIAQAGFGGMLSVFASGFAVGATIPENGNVFQGLEVPFINPLALNGPIWTLESLALTGLVPSMGPMGFS